MIQICTLCYKHFTQTHTTGVTPSFDFIIFRRFGVYSCIIFALEIYSYINLCFLISLNGHSLSSVFRLHSINTKYTFIPRKMSEYIPSN